MDDGISCAGVRGMSEKLRPTVSLCRKAADADGETSNAGCRPKDLAACKTWQLLVSHLTQRPKTGCVNRECSY